MVPIHLEGVDVFALLAEWMDAARAHQPHWTLYCWERTKVICSLTWKFGSSQHGTINKAAVSAREAVRLAVDEFAEWRKSAVANS